MNQLEQVIKLKDLLKRDYFRLFLILIPSFFAYLVNWIFTFEIHSESFNLYSKAYPILSLSQIIISYGGIQVLSHRKIPRVNIYLLIFVSLYSTLFIPELAPYIILFSISEFVVLNQVINRNIINHFFWLLLLVLIRVTIIYDISLSVYISLGSIIFIFPKYINFNFFENPIKNFLNFSSLFSLFHIIILQLPLILLEETKTVYINTIIYTGVIVVCNAWYKNIKLIDLQKFKKIDFINPIFLSFFLIFIFIFFEFSLMLLISLFLKLFSIQSFIILTALKRKNIFILLPSIMSLIFLITFRDQLLTYIIYDSILIFYIFLNYIKIIKL